jgi:hypothetical protein
MDNILCCGYGSDAGCRFLDTGYLKVLIFFYPASSIQYLRHSEINVRFQNFVFFVSGLSGLGCMNLYFIPHAVEIYFKD